MPRKHCDELTLSFGIKFCYSKKRINDFLSGVFLWVIRTNKFVGELMSRWSLFSWFMVNGSVVRGVIKTKLLQGIGAVYKT